MERLTPAKKPDNYYELVEEKLAQYEDSGMPPNVAINAGRLLEKTVYVIKHEVCYENTDFLFSPESSGLSEDPIHIYKIIEKKINKLSLDDECNAFGFYVFSRREDAERAVQLAKDGKLVIPGVLA